MNVIKIEDLWKEYRLGVIGHGTLTRDLQSWWARSRGEEDPNVVISSQKKEKPGQIDGNRFWALRNINLQVEQGEILGIIGKNGAGKSTFLKILSRITAPSQGNIKVRGRIASLLEVGTGFHPELTGIENIFLNGAILGMSKHEIKCRLGEIIDFSGIEPFIETPVKRYSSGMYVRLAFAVAAHLETEILVVDEVLAVGDAEFQKKCINKIKTIGEGGKTVLFVSHNIAAVKNLCSKAMIIKEGSIFNSGSVEKIVSQYLSGFSNLNENLEKRLQRDGNGGLRIISVDFVDEHNNKGNRIISGQDVVLKIAYKNENIKSNIAIKIGIQVCTLQGVAVFFNHNELDGYILTGIKESGSIICKIRKLPLVPADYFLNISLRVSGGELLDKVQSALKFSVIGSSFYLSGKCPSVQYGLCLVDADWSHETN